MVASGKRLQAKRGGGYTVVASKTVASDEPRDKDLLTLKAEGAALEAHATEALPTPLQLSALRVYASDSGFSEMNSRLRGSPNARHASSSSIAQLRAAIDSQRPFKLPIDVYRGMTFRNPTDRDLFLKAVRNGKFVNNGFLSTSISPAVARSFAKPGDYGSTLIRIKATKGLWTGRRVRTGGEHEVVLNHKSRFRVVSSRQGSDGVLHVVMEQTR